MRIVCAGGAFRLPHWLVVRQEIDLVAASFRVCVTTTVLRQGTASQLAEKVGFLGGRSFSSDNRCLACNGLQPLRKRLEAFFRNLFSR